MSEIEAGPAPLESGSVAGSEVGGAGSVEEAEIAVAVGSVVASGLQGGSETPPQTQPSERDPAETMPPTKRRLSPREAALARKARRKKTAAQLGTRVAYSVNTVEDQPAPAFVEGHPLSQALMAQKAHEK